MREPPVQSFGRRTEPPVEEQGPVILPPMLMPPVRVPVVLVVDVTSLRDAAAQITEMVAQAVRDGFTTALAEHDPEAVPECRGAGLDPGATPSSEQLADLTR